jgi:hypothetical protein
MLMRFVTSPPTAAFLCMIRQPTDDRHSAMPWAFAAAAGESLNPTTPQVIARRTSCIPPTVHSNECSHAHVLCASHLNTRPSSQCSKHLWAASLQGGCPAASCLGWPRRRLSPRPLGTAPNTAAFGGALALCAMVRTSVRYRHYACSDLPAFQAGRSFFQCSWRPPVSISSGSMAVAKYAHRVAAWLLPSMLKRPRSTRARDLRPGPS